MNLKKLSMHPDLDCFAPATEAEKEYMVQMRPSSTFFKDGVKRLKKNKVAVISYYRLTVGCWQYLLPARYHCVSDGRNFTCRMHGPKPCAP